MDRPHPPFCRLQGSRERLCWPLLGPTGRPRWALMMPSASPAFSPFSVRVVGGFLARTRNRSKSDLHFGIYTVAHKYVETFVDFYQQRPITRIDAGLSIKVDTRTETWLTDFHETLHVYNVARNIRIFQVFFFFFSFYWQLLTFRQWKQFFDLALGKRTFRDGNGNERISCLRTTNITVKPDFSL